MNDFQIFLLLNLVRLSSHRRPATVAIFQLIQERKILPTQLFSFLTDIPELTNHFQHELRDLAFRLLTFTKSGQVMKEWRNTKQN